MEKNSMADSNELEDGEIEFDCSFDDIYTPLERPTSNVPVAAKTVVESDDNEAPTSSDGDSSDDEQRRPKIKKSLNSFAKDVNKEKKKNLNIWCNVLQAETVSSTLTDCNLDEYQKRIRGLVPYSPRRFNNYNGNKVSCGENNSSSGKRNYDGQHVSDKKFFKDSNVNEKRGSSKIIPPLNGTSWESDEMLAKEMADKLNEVKIDLILRAIQTSGKDQIIPIFEETRKVEEEGGMLIMNGSRRRTSGGVFFYLLKTAEDIPQIQLKQIFEADKQDTAAQKKKVARQIRKQQAEKLKEAFKSESDLKVS